MLAIVREVFLHPTTMSVIEDDGDNIVVRRDGVRKLAGRAHAVHFAADRLVVDLRDGRQIAVPLAWFPRLASATDDQRAKWELIGRGIGIHWPAVDEDISVDNLLSSDGELLTYRDTPANVRAFD
jgi:uncharacterized protein DUF2442